MWHACRLLQTRRAPPNWPAASPFHAKEAPIGIVRAAISLWLTIRAAGLRAGGQNVVIDGQTLDHHTHAMLLMVARNREGARPSLEQARALYRQGPPSVGLKQDRAVPTEHHVIDDGPALPARLYRGCDAADPASLLVYFHGGGWTLGDLDTQDRFCRLLARRAGGLVLSIDYRLAPEHPFPAAFDDALRAFHWARRHAQTLGADPARIAIGGDSAGGNLAAAVAVALAGDGTEGPCAQFLIYPALDLTTAPRSAELFGEGFLLTRRIAEAFVLAYAPDGTDRSDPRMSPLLASPDVLGRLPPAIIVTAGFDPLRDQGLAWAEALRAAGVPVAAANEAALIHGFADFAGVIPAARTALDRAADALAFALREPATA